VTVDYAAPDREVVDYQMYCLDTDVRDRQSGAPLLLRGPRPRTLNAGEYFACLGAAQTFGRFCATPFPTILEAALGLPAINFGRGGAGPSFFLDDKLLDYVNNARFAIVQVMAGRSESNSLFESKGLGHYRRRSNGADIDCDRAFSELLATRDIDDVRAVVAETRENWIVNTIALLQAIRVPKVLFWFSERRPAYRESYDDVYALFGRFPQLVNDEMVKCVRRHADDYVECVSTNGRPHMLFSRVSGQPTTITDPWGGTWEKNWYYPSPVMHAEAARALTTVCRRYVGLSAWPGLGRWPLAAWRAVRQALGAD
jgi:hypothetical protein